VLVDKEDSFRQVEPYDVYADISLVGISRSVRRHKRIAIGTFLTIISASILIAVFSKPIYSSSITLSPASGGSSRAGGLARLIRGFGGGGSFQGGGSGVTRNSRAVGLSALSSPYFTRAFIEDTNLLPILFAARWDVESGSWNTEDPDDIPTLSEGYEKFSRILEVFDDPGTGLVTVSIQWEDPILAANWTNKLVKDANERLRAQTIDDANLTIKYLNQELAKTNAVELQQALYFLVENAIQKKTVAKVQKEYAFTVLSPAIPADYDKYIKPNRVFILSVGFILGALSALFIAILMGPIETIVKDIRAAK
jgi:uncharacterized protein involved in exopolysaccharide biosynthesis